MIKNKILIIIFSYNRALQLDCLLRSIKNRFKYDNFEIKIIYHTSGRHLEGYDKLINKYKDEYRINFVEREEDYNFFRDKLPYLFKNRNLWRYFKHNFLRKKLDNFKKLLESILYSTNSEFTMFITDDGYFYKDVNIPHKVLQLIRDNPNQTSYRMYVGENLHDFPNGLKKIKGMYKWNYYDKEMYRHWAYPFSVDVTIYHTNTLLEIIKPILYHMPTTFEAFVCTHCKKKKLFSIGYSPVKSNYLGLFINRVSTIGDNFSGNIDNDKLNDLFKEDYELFYEFEKPPFEQALIPDKIKLINNNCKKDDIIINLNEK
jgi:hypothetical protein